MIVYYQYFAKRMPFWVTSHMDFSSLKLVEAVFVAMATFKEYRGRILESGRGKKEKRDERKQPVLEIFHRSSKIKDGMKKHTIARVIRKEFEEQIKHLETPSLDSIKRYLREEGLIN